MDQVQKVEVEQVHWMPMNWTGFNTEKLELRVKSVRLEPCVKISALPPNTYVVWDMVPQIANLQFSH